MRRKKEINTCEKVFVNVLSFVAVLAFIVLMSEQEERIAANGHYDRGYCVAVAMGGTICGLFNCF